jgi:hypothetical protein
MFTLKRIPSVFMYAMNIQNDVIGLVRRQNCKSKQVTNCIAWPSRCHDMIHDIYDGPCDPLQLDSICISSLSFADDLIIFSDSHTGLQNALNNLKKYCYDRQLS